MKKVLLFLFLVILVFVLTSCLPKEEVNNNDDLTEEVPEESSQIINTDFIKNNFLNQEKWTFIKNEPRTVNDVRSISYSYRGNTRAVLEGIKEEIYASGLVSDFLRTVYSDGEFVFVSGDIGGYSYFEISNIDNLPGNVYNVNHTVEGGRFIPGRITFSKNPVDGRVYARYWDKILDAKTGDILFDGESISDSNEKFAPTNGSIGNSPKQRFLIDDFENFWVGTSEVEDDDPTQRGLYIINNDFNSIEKILDQHIWKIFQDSSDNIWVLAKDGVYKYIKTDASYDFENPEVYDLGNLYPGEFLEYNSEFYLVVNNYFDQPEDGTNENYLYKLNSSDVFEEVKVIENTENTGNIILFEYNNKMYLEYYNKAYEIDINDNYNLNEDLFLKGIGYDQIDVDSDGKIFSVGNVNGLVVHNYPNNGDVKTIIQAETAEGLASNDIQNIFYDETNDSVYFGHNINGYTVYKDGELSPYTFNHDITEIVLGLFDYNDNVYASTASNIFDITIGSENMQNIGELRNNGEKIYLHNNYIWSFFNRGSTDDGEIRHLNLDTGNTKEDFNFDNNYQIFDMIGKDEDNIFVGVGSSKTINKFPFVFNYNYSEDKLTKINLNDDNAMGIHSFTKDATGNIYGISPLKVYKYSDGEWNLFSEIESGNDIRDSVVYKDYLIILTGWNSLYQEGKNDGIEIVDLISGENIFYSRDELGLPIGLKNLEISKESDKNILWIGSYNGLVKLEITE